MPEKWLKTQETIGADVDGFDALTQRYVDVKDKSSGKRVQKVNIYFPFVADVEIPVISDPVVANLPLDGEKRCDHCGHTVLCSSQI